jgi:hypothetical protein
MPLVRYFAGVGSVLVMLLLATNWYFTTPTAEPVHSGIDRPVIRISSIEVPPERIVIDTNLPTIVPAQPTTVIEPQRPQEVFAQIAPSLPPVVPTSREGIQKKKKAEKPDPLKGLVARRPAPSATAAAARGYRVAESVNRMSIIDIIKERFTRGLFIGLN